ncbi:TolC family protein [Nonlabens ulvanivorans]|uniref:TolC family protein n=1 Tax=Nonlabens ulvanivorans TaxID=906888 RepID=UPI0037CA7F44
MPIRKRSKYLFILGTFISFMINATVLESPLSRKRIQHTTQQSTVALDSTEMSFREYMGFVKAHHPIAKQAQLLIDGGQANLLRSRGGFDPKIEVDYDRKEFKGTEYYDQLNAMFKIPTWYGVEFKAGVERNEGTFLDPSNTVPENGLYNAGVSVNLGQGFLINERMATLRKAKIYSEQSLVDRDLLVNAVLYEAALAYFKWWQIHEEYKVYDQFYENAQIRFQAVKSSFVAGDKAAIDTVEAGIAAQNRALNREQARIQLVKQRLELSNFLWLNEVPVELQPNIVPQEDLNNEIDATLEIYGFTLNEFTIENHPKLRSMNFKIDQLDIDRRLKANKLLPKLTLDYNFLSPEWNEFNSFQTANYKGGITFSMPLFLRKERGDLRLAKIKIADAQYDLASSQLEIKNKVTSIFNELDSYNVQVNMITNIVESSQIMLTGEERKFDLGDSSLFLINSREVKLIDSKLKEINTYKKLFISKANLFKSLAVMPENL